MNTSGKMLLHTAQGRVEVAHVQPQPRFTPQCTSHSKCISHCTQCNCIADCTVQKVRQASDLNPCMPPLSTSHGVLCTLSKV